MAKSHYASPETVRRWESVYGQGDDFLSHTISKRMAAVVDLLRREDPADGPLVADIGCGSGVVSRELIRLGYDVTGVDFSEPMLETARKIPGLKLQVGDVEHLPFESNAFDKIICLGVIGNLPDERKALAELHRVLKPRGTLILTVRNLLAASVLLDAPGLAVRIIRRFRRRFQTGGRAMGARHYHRNFIPWRLKRNLVAAGFTPGEWTGLGYDFPTVKGKRIIPLKAGLRFSGMVERMARHRTFGFLNNWGLFHLIVVTKPSD
jgi:ubiquinone/menaquinone biosynthesis C-methylase UbiE